MILDRFRRDDRLAVVTGAARGIGQAIARALYEAGAEVILADLDGDAVEKTARELVTDGHRALALALDVVDSSSVEAAATGIVRQHGRLDILVNNAGVGSIGSALDLSDEEWRRVIDVNTNAVFWCARSFGRHMVERRAGAIVNVGSMSGLIVNKGFSSAHYMVSKAGTLHVTRALAVEWATFGVRVNAVAPGYTVTNQTDLLRSDPVLHRAAIESTPMARFADPSEIASAVLFLASDAASYCTGTILTVDGGHTCW